ncbi:hypothetical protein [Humibacter sp.]|uniref:hypothetical protein n=1 Tax=Humibacter sp. TaxID=1940291 RepID=UPI003F80DD01
MSETRTYTEAEVLDLMWWALAPFAFDYSPSVAFEEERKAYHRERFRRELDRRRQSP